MSPQKPIFHNIRLERGCSYFSFHFKCLEQDKQKIKQQNKKYKF